MSPNLGLDVCLRWSLRYILGTTTQGKPLSEALARATSGADAARIEKEWDSMNKLITFDQGTSLFIYLFHHVECAA